MIFYFSATGNTQYAAQRLAQATGDYTVSIRECMRDGRRSFTLKTNENFGIVTPTYFQGMPLFLQEFLSSLKLEDEGRTHYAYAVSTCGVSYGSAGTQAVRAAEKAGIHLDATFRIRTVDNWNPYFDMNDAAYIRSAEKTAEKDLKEVCAKAAAREKGIYLADTFGSKKEAELAAAYEESRKTSLFQVSDACVGCGTCAAQCPIQAITIQDGRPVWSKESCLLCLGCVHKCPKNAIAYTQATIGHGQYVNPHISSVV